MKKRIMAVYALAGVLAASPILTSCVEDDESTSVSALRDAKEQARQAVDALKVAQLEAEKIVAQAEIAFDQAKRAHEEAISKLDEEERAQEEKEYQLRLKAIQAEQEANLKKTQLDLKEAAASLRGNADEEFFDLCDWAENVSILIDEFRTEKLETQVELEYLKVDKKFNPFLQGQIKNELKSQISKTEAYLEKVRNAFEGGFENLEEFWFNQNIYMDSLKNQRDKLEAQLSAKESELNLKIYYTLYRQSDDDFLSFFNLRDLVRYPIENYAQTGYAYLQQVVDFIKKYPHNFSFRKGYLCIDNQFCEQSYTEFDYINRRSETFDLNIEQYDVLSVDPTALEKLSDFEEIELLMAEQTIKTLKSNVETKTNEYETALETEDEEAIEAAKLSLEEAKEELDDYSKAHAVDMEFLKDYRNLLLALSEDTEAYQEYMAAVADVNQYIGTFDAMFKQYTDLKCEIQNIKSFYKIIVELGSSESLNDIYELQSDIIEAIENELDYLNENLVKIESEEDENVIPFLEEQLKLIDNSIKVFQGLFNDLMAKVDARVASSTK